MNAAAAFSVGPALKERPTRIAVATAYMPFFNEIMPADHPAQMAERGTASAERLAGLGEVMFTGLIDDHESGHAAGRRIKAFDPDVIVLAPAMAAPAGYQYEAVRDCARVPIVILDIHALQTIPADYTAHSIVPNSVTVGCMMINNVLRRQGRWSPVVTGFAGDERTWQRARETVAVAAVAGRLAKARFGVLGKPLDGYLNVVCDAGALNAATGATLVELAPDEFTDVWHGIASADVEALENAYRQRVRIEVDDGDIEELRGSMRLALALQTIVQRHRLDGGTFNCRDAFAVGNREIGVIGCLANTHLTTHGFPFTCTGDVITALAMFLGKRLGGDSYYCELDTLDYEADAVLCANTGEGDFRQAASCESCTIRRSGQESGRNAHGCNVRYDMPDRPGTAVAFTPRADAPGGHVIIAAEGQIAGSPKTMLNLPSMYFRFRDTPVGEAMSRWIEAGATHHTGISSGRHGRALEMIARLSGIGCERVS